MPMKSPPHPGLSVWHECLEPLGLSVTEAAKRLGVSRRQLSAIINGHAGISPEMAIRFDKAFGGGAGTRHRLQAAYELAQAMRRVDSIRVERLLPVAQSCGTSENSSYGTEHRYAGIVRSLPHEDVGGPIGNPLHVAGHVLSAIRKQRLR